jgi:SAM-dependent methyltransferase
MNIALNKETRSKLSGAFLEEYSTEKSIRRYTKDTAGHGISYLLENVYGRMYLELLEKYIPKSKLKVGVRVLEFGCGGGMNLVHLVSMMERHGIALECAYGTDFSQTLIEAANHEAEKFLPPVQNTRVRFCVARNENLVSDMTTAPGLGEPALLGSFDLILGVNTIRYCHRLRREVECAQSLFNLLTAGGVCIVIDMNRNFPLFRSRLRDRLTKEKRAYVLPSLEEYARPFSSVGFEIIQKKNFCWIPHSAGPWLTSSLRALTPALSTLAPNHAMRSLVVSRRPPHR